MLRAHLVGDGMRHVDGIDQVSPGRFLSRHTRRRRLQTRIRELTVTIPGLRLTAEAPLLSATEKAKYDDERNRCDNVRGV